MHKAPKSEKEIEDHYIHNASSFVTDILKQILSRF